MDAISSIIPKHILDAPGSAHPSLLMSGLLGLGGAIGFLKKRSVPSLVGGLTLGAAFFYSGHLIASGESPATGHDVALAASVVTAAMMGARFRKTRAFMPGGVLMVAGGGSAVYQAIKSAEWHGFL
ncbi:unnamed protein product [Pedinophyceae sp. YPF-701]|nr:unnamed protein product [Pedinophyceae sp. YPF-701]